MAQASISPQKRTRIRQLAEQGHSKSMIAKMTGLGHGTIDKYVTLDQQRQQPLKQFKNNLSDLLHEILMSGMRAQANVLTSLADEDVASMSVAERRMLAQTLGTVNGIVYDKIRLQDGKSTVNSSHHLQVNLAHQHLFPSPTSSVSVGKEVDATKGKDCGIMSHSPDNHTQAIDNTEITGD